MAAQRMIDIDFDKDGRQDGFIRLPHSVHQSAYGWIPIPIVQLKNGDGPSILVMAGVHGDEFEGQIAICKLVQKLRPEKIRGRLIFLPMANYPAAISSLRTSPLDNGNLNRSFPGDSQGEPTKAIAHIIETELMHRVDVSIDLHSGGSSLDHLAAAFVDRGSDPESEAKAIELLEVFGLPYGVLYRRDGFSSYSCGAAMRQGVLSILTELGGAGTVSLPIQRLVDRGLLRLFAHFGVVDAQQDHTDPATMVQIVEETDATDMMYYATAEGVMEPLVELGDRVKTGDPAAFIHTPETPWLPSHRIDFKADGIVLARRFPARVCRGDCMFQLARLVI